MQNGVAAQLKDSLVIPVNDEITLRQLLADDTDELFPLVERNSMHLRDWLDEGQVLESVVGQVLRDQKVIPASDEPLDNVA